MAKTGENLEKSKRKRTCIKRNHNKVKSSLLRRNNRVQKAAQNTFEVLKGKKNPVNKEVYIQQRYTSKMKGKQRTFPKQKLK